MAGLLGFVAVSVFVLMGTEAVVTSILMTIFKLLSF